MNNAYIRAQQCKVKEAKFPFVKIGSQYWTTKNLSLSVTPQGNTIPEMQANGNVEKVVNGTMEGTYVAGVAPNWVVGRGNPFENTITTYAGISSQSITNPTASTGAIGQSISIITIGMWYKVTFWAKNIKGAGGWLSDYTSGNFIQIPIVSTVWTQYSIYFKSIGQLGIGFYANTNAVNDTNGISFDNVSVQEIGWAGSQELYDGIYAQTTGTVEQKTYAAVKAAAMWCNYNNDAPTGVIYGKLYNWFAVKLLQMDIDYYNAANPDKPYIWRMPTQAEFQALSTYLGGDSVSGGHLKESGLAHWTSPNAGADNSSGFSAIGSSSRIENTGLFGIYNNELNLWANTVGDQVMINDISTALTVRNRLSGRGYSIRLIKV